MRITGKLVLIIGFCLVVGEAGATSGWEKLHNLIRDRTAVVRIRTALAMAKLEAGSNKWWDGNVGTASANSELAAELLGLLQEVNRDAEYRPLRDAIASSIAALGSQTFTGRHSAQNDWWYARVQAQLRALTDVRKLFDSVGGALEADWARFSPEIQILMTVAADDQFPQVRTALSALLVELLHAQDHLARVRKLIAEKSAIAESNEQELQDLQTKIADTRGILNSHSPYLALIFKEWRKPTYESPVFLDGLEITGPVYRAILATLAKFRSAGEAFRHLPGTVSFVGTVVDRKRDGVFRRKERVKVTLMLKVEVGSHTTNTRLTKPVEWIVDAKGNHVNLADTWTQLDGLTEVMNHPDFLDDAKRLADSMNDILAARELSAAVAESIVTACVAMLGQVGIEAGIELEVAEPVVTPAQTERDKA